MNGIRTYDYGAKAVKASNVDRYRYEKISLKFSMWILRQIW